MQAAACRVLGRSWPSSRGRRSAATTCNRAARARDAMDRARVRAGDAGAVTDLPVRTAVQDGSRSKPSRARRSPPPRLRSEARCSRARPGRRVPAWSAAGRQLRASASDFGPAVTSGASLGKPRQRGNKRRTTRRGPRRLDRRRGHPRQRLVATTAFERFTRLCAKTAAVSLVRIRLEHVEARPARSSTSARCGDVSGAPTQDWIRVAGCPWDTSPCSRRHRLLPGLVFPWLPRPETEVAQRSALARNRDRCGIRSAPPVRPGSSAATHIAAPRRRRRFRSGSHTVDPEG